MATKKKAPRVDEKKFNLWKRKGAALATSKNQNQWAIAKWMCDGEEGFPKVAYREAAAVTGMEVDTLRQFAYVFRNISTRVDGLSFGHHRAVAGVKDPERQKEWLDLALKTKLSVASLAAHIRFFAKEAARTADVFSAPDRHAKRVLASCNTFLADSALASFLEGDKIPSLQVRDAVLDKLRWTASYLNEGLDRLTRAWATYDSEHPFQKHRPPKELTPEQTRLIDERLAEEREVFDKVRATYLIFTDAGMAAQREGRNAEYQKLISSTEFKEARIAMGAAHKRWNAISDQVRRTVLAEADGETATAVAAGK